MAKHIVKCSICGEQFDLNSVQGVKTSKTRYAHQSCFPKGELVPMVTSNKVSPDEKALTDYIKELYGKKANWVLIKKQIKDLTSKGYTLKGIKTTLVYIYEVKKNDVEKSNGGIGLVPYCYQEAYDYYYNIWQAQQRAEQGIEKINHAVTREIVIKPPKQERRHHKLFKFLDKGDIDEN